MSTPEYNATEVRTILQELFPARKLVLSQFTFFNASGVSKPTGTTFRRGRRCYRLEDLLPVAVMLSLKEQGIPNKRAEKAPTLIREYIDEIFTLGHGSRVSGFGDVVSLQLLGSEHQDAALESMLLEGANDDLYWSIDVGFLACELQRVAQKIMLEEQADELIRAVA